MTLGNAMNMANISYGMSGDKGNESYFLQHNGSPISLDQYNNARQARAEAAAQRGGYELLPAREYPKPQVSLFGPKYAPTPKTQAQINAHGEYLARRRSDPASRAEMDAYAGKVNRGIAAGHGLGYGNHSVNGVVVNSRTGQRVTGFGYADENSLTPTFFYEGDAAQGQSMGNQTGRQGQSSYQSNAFMDGLNTQLGNYDGYTVNSDLDAAEQNLRAMLANAQNNNAGASTIGRIQMALDDIGRLGQDRTSQQAIIDQARRDAQNSLTGFGTAYTDVDYRNAQALDGLSRQLDQITNPNLDVELNYDFSDMSGDVDPYREIVQNMRDRRMRELNMLGEDIAGIGSSLDGFYTNTDPLTPELRDGPFNAPDYEMVLGENGFLHPVLKAPDTTMPIPEGIINDKPIPGGMQLRDIRSASEVYDIRDQLNDALNSLDVYGSGTRSNELRGEIFNQDEIYGQLADQLRGRQGQIETDAQAQLDALAGARLTRPDDIRAFEEALRDLGGQRDLFDAATAADELERLTSQIQSARSDLERDEAARIARQELERRRALQTQGGGSAFNSNMTADQYSAYLRILQMGDEDPYYQTSGFSRGLGLA